MKITKEHLKIMKKCIGFRFVLFSNKFKAKRNRYYSHNCDLDQMKQWNDLCKIQFAKYISPKNRQPYYALTEKGIQYLELKYSVQISI